MARARALGTVGAVSSGRDGTNGTPKRELVTREEAAKTLGVSRSAVRIWEESGELNPVRAGLARRQVMLDRAEVEALAARRPAQQSRRSDGLYLETAEREAAAFAAFERGLDVVAVVVAERMRPSHVLELWKQYSQCRRSLSLHGERLAELAAVLDVDSTTLTAERLVELVSQLRDRLRSARRSAHAHGDS